VSKALFIVSKGIVYCAGKVKVNVQLRTVIVLAPKSGDAKVTFIVLTGYL